MIQIKRLPVTFFALIALLGVISCVAIEPALAQLDNHQHTESAETHAEEADGHCDFICNSSHHLWTIGSGGFVFNQSIRSLGSVIDAQFEMPDPPLNGIFQPPIVLA